MFRDIEFFFIKLAIADIKKFVKGATSSFFGFFKNIFLVIVFYLKLYLYSGIIFLIVLPTLFWVLTRLGVSLTTIDTLYGYARFSGAKIEYILTLVMYCTIFYAYVSLSLLFVMFSIIMILADYFDIALYYFTVISSVTVVNFNIYYFLFSNKLSAICVFFIFFTKVFSTIFYKSIYPVIQYFCFFAKLPILFLFLVLKQLKLIFFSSRAACSLFSKSYGDKATNSDGEDVISYANDIIEFVEQDRFFVFDNLHFFLIDFSLIALIAFGVRFIVLKAYKFFKNK